MKVKVSTIWENWKKTKKILGHQTQYEEIGDASERLIRAIKGKILHRQEDAFSSAKIETAINITGYAPIRNSLAAGGNQGWFTDYSAQEIAMNRCGCGVIAAADLILHLEGRKMDSMDAYQIFVKSLQRKYFPLIPFIGMPWFEFVWGLNRYFRINKLQYRASYGVRPWRLEKRIRDLLRRNIPVILGIGQNLPPVIHDEMMTFYRKNADGTYVPAAYTRAHFVTILGIDGDYLHIASWGQEYDISLKEFKRYVHRFSSWLVCGIIQIKTV